MEVASGPKKILREEQPLHLNCRWQVMTDKDVVIYVIDDDVSVRKSLSLLLRSAGYGVETFVSAEEFLSKAALDSIGCIILDVKMRGMSGLDMQEQLGRNDQYMPIIFITGHGDIPMSVQAVKKGAIDFLTKPFDDTQLLSLIESAVEQCRRKRRCSMRYAIFADV